MYATLKLYSKLKRELLSHKAPLPIRGCSSSCPYEVGSYGSRFSSSALSVAPSPAQCVVHSTRSIYQLFAPVVGCPRIWLLALRPPYGLLAVDWLPQLLRGVQSLLPNVRFNHR